MSGLLDRSCVIIRPEQINAEWLRKTVIISVGGGAVVIGLLVWACITTEKLRKSKRPKKPEPQAEEIPLVTVSVRATKKARKKVKATKKIN